MGKKRPWTRAEFETLEYLLSKGYTHRQIAARFDRSPAAVQKMASRLKITSPTVADIVRSMLPKSDVQAGLLREIDLLQSKTENLIGTAKHKQAMVVLRKLASLKTAVMRYRE